MTNRATLLALAERCEQAEGPDLGLDEAIAVATGWRAAMPFHACPPLTRSIDAAMARVPACHSISMLKMATHGGVTIYRDDKTYRSNPCSTLPLAIWAAVLRALAETADE